MFISKRTIGVKEFDSAAVRIVSKGVKAVPRVVYPPHPDLSFGPLRIAGEWAKGIYGGVTIGILDCALAVLESTIMSQRLTANSWIAGSNLRLREALLGSYQGVRDFSKSTRVGEYGQAVCLVFTQDALKYPNVFDFDMFCQLIGVPLLPHGSTKPDYVGWNGLQYVLVESKASLGSDSIKTELRDGLLQCDAGQAHIAAHSAFVPAASYCVLTSFQLDVVPENTEVYFADPEGKPNVPDWAHGVLTSGYYKFTLRALGCTGDFDNVFSERLYGERSLLPGFGDRFFERVEFVEQPRWLEGLPSVFNKKSFLYSVWIDSLILNSLRQGNGALFKTEVDAFREAVSLFEEADPDIRVPDMRGIVQAYRDGLVVMLKDER